MKKTKILLAIYLITATIFTISGFFPHLIVFWKDTGEIYYFFKGSEFFAAPFFIITLILISISKIKHAFFISIIGCIVYITELFFMYYVIVGFDDYKHLRTYIYYPGIYIGIISYLSLIILTIMMYFIHDLKEKELFKIRLW